jgi:methanogenic corrinoid protein MtbC1
MGKYSIKELEHLSGIKAHTIRIWEKRHRIIEPDRTPTNIRYYSDDDLKKIINVSLLNANGFRISKIASLAPDEIFRKAAELADKTNDAHVQIDRMIMAMIDLDEERFVRLLNGLIRKYEFEKTITEIVYPFLEKIGILWQTNNISPAQEHFVSNIIRQKIIVAIDQLPMAAHDAEKAVIFLPEGELHEIGMLFHYYTIKKLGYRVFYLGQTVPYQDLISVCEDHHPSIVLTSFTSAPRPNVVQGYVDQLCRDLATARIYATGSLLIKMAIRFPSNFQIFHNALNLRHLLTS